MSRHLAWFRYTVAIAALMLAFAFSIRLSDRGFLFDSRSPDALATESADDGGYDLQSLTILNRVLLQLRDNYVVPERIDPARMLVHTLDRVQNSVPEVVALFDAGLDDNPTRVEIRIADQSQTFELGEVESLWEMSFQLREIFRFLQDNVDRTDADLRDIEYAAINGMLSTLDPHSVLMTPDIYADMQTSNRGSFGGLGIVISIRDGQLTIISPITGTPASRAGLRAGDRIVEINEESTVNMPLDEAVQRLRGDVGTSVTVEIMRSGWTEPHQFSLQREIINIESVTSQALGEGIGYVQISSFQGNTHDDLVAALDALDDELGGMEGLVLDLRNNPGGLLEQAIRVSDTFLSQGTIVTTVGVGNRLREENVANAAGTQPSYPIVVLINPGSASASEIVAGALKNHNRALIVGDQSFGKGTVQNLYEFQDGSALKLTVAQYLTPGDISIQGVGIVPDIMVFPATITDELIDLYPGEAAFVREGDLATSLTSDRVALEQERPAAIVKYAYEPEEIDPEAIVDPDAFELDFEIDFARQLLLDAGETWERTEMLGEVMDRIDEARVQQLVDLQERLRTRRVDWTTGDNVIQPVTLEARTDRTGNRVDAGDEVALTLSITNEGTRPLYQVRAVSDSDYELFSDREFVFGVLQPGETREWTVPLTVPLEDRTRLETIDFRAWADTIDLGAQTELELRVSGRERPHWGLSWSLHDEAEGNGDGRLQVGEAVTFRLDVTNTGRGDAEETILILRNQSDASVFLRSGREELERLAAGATHAAEFEFELRDAPEGGEVRLDVEVFDTVFREFLHEELTIAVSDETATPMEREGFVEVGEDAPIHGGAGLSMPVVAEARAGAVLATDRYADGWYRVTYGDGAQGWVDESRVTQRPGGSPTAGAVTPLLTYQPPLINLSTTVIDTDEAMYTIRGDVSDDRTVRDFYVVLQNRLDERTTQSLKRAYQYVGVPSTTISEDIPLQPGMNRITVVARDDDRATSSEVIYVYRHD